MFESVYCNYCAGIYLTSRIVVNKGSHLTGISKYNLTSDFPTDIIIEALT